jgi:ABC-type iron transport system FetAB permease component
MASSYSTDLKLEIMVTGENSGTWGDITNTNLVLLQQSIAGYEDISIAGGAQTTALVMSDGALSNARNAVIRFTGTITGNQVVTIPDGIEKTYTVINATTGAFTVEFKTVSGSGTTFAASDKVN